MPKLMGFTNHIEKRIVKYLTENNYQFSDNQEPIEIKEHPRRSCGNLMRPIKFRAIIEDSYSKNNGSWVYGGLIKYGSFYAICEDSLYIDDDGITEDLVYIDERTVGQFTGLYDKNGKEVYEGDIIKCSRGCLHSVYFEKEYAGTYIGGMPAFYLSGLNNGYAWIGVEEVVGNIHENPELLEGDKSDE